MRLGRMRDGIILQATPQPRGAAPRARVNVDPHHLFEQRADGKVYRRSAVGGERDPRGLRHPRPILQSRVAGKISLCKKITVHALRREPSCQFFERGTGTFCLPRVRGKAVDVVTVLFDVELEMMQCALGFSWARVGVEHLRASGTTLVRLERRQFACFVGSHAKLNTITNSPEFAFRNRD